METAQAEKDTGKMKLDFKVIMLQEEEKNL